MTRIAWALWLCGCVVGEDGGQMMTMQKTATATVAPTGATPAAGTAKFTLDSGVVSLLITMTAGPEGMHGFHIHQTPACGNAGMDAGGHWDGGDVAGDGATHGLPGGATTHLGDLGNITLDANGAGMLMVSNPAWKLGDGSAADVVDHAVIFHMDADDGTMPSAGARLGCGIIALD